MAQHASSHAGIGLNPLPGILHRSSFTLNVPTLRAAFSEIATTGFTAVQADIPEGLNPSDYLALLSEYGLRPCPGYFSGDFTTDPAGVAEAARRHAAAQAALGQSEVFVAGDLAPSRITTPAIGADYDAGRLATIIEHLASVAEAIRAEGGTPCL